MAVGSNLLLRLHLWGKLMRCIWWYCFHQTLQEVVMVVPWHKAHLGRMWTLLRKLMTNYWDTMMPTKKVMQDTVKHRYLCSCHHTEQLRRQLCHLQQCQGKACCRWASARPRHLCVADSRVEINPQLIELKTYSLNCFHIPKWDLGIHNP